MTEPLIPGGYILLSRKIIESKIWDKPPLYIKVWIYLLSSAQHSDYKLLKRSELRTSIPEIQEKCSWHVGYRKEVPTKDQIFNILEWLRNPCDSNDESNDDTTMITTTKATHGMLIKIVNYNVYQDAKNYESNNDDDDEIDAKALREQQTADNINKNVKNDNLKDIYSDEIIEKTPIKKSKKTQKQFTEEDKEYKLARYLSKRIAERLDRPLKDEKTLQSWANDFNKMIRIDKYDADEMKDVLDFCQEHYFWKKQILSASNFRDKYEKLLSQWKG